MISLKLSWESVDMKHWVPQLITDFIDWSGDLFILQFRPKSVKCPLKGHLSTLFWFQTLKAVSLLLWVSKVGHSPMDPQLIPQCTDSDLTVLICLKTLAGCCESPVKLGQAPIWGQLHGICSLCTPLQCPVWKCRCRFPVRINPPVALGASCSGVSEIIHSSAKGVTHFHWSEIGSNEGRKTGKKTTGR